MPNPTTPAVDVAEGRRLLEEYTKAVDVHRKNQTYESFESQREAERNWQAWRNPNAFALLRAASENVSLREQVVSANEQRDAAVREVEAMKRLLAELADNLETTTQDSFLRGGGWQGSEDCLGIERARAALASAAQKQAKPALTIEDSSGGANG